LPDSSEPELTIAFAYFDQPNMLRKQVEVFSGYSAELLARIKLIIVDDCSHKHAANKACKSFPVSTDIFQIIDNIPWNQMGARNLAMKHSLGWTLLIDPDHTVPEALSKHLLDKVIPTANRNKYYLVPRAYARKREVMKVAPNLYMIHHEAYWKGGGMDEGFRGHKGWSDITFRIAMEGVGVKRATLDDAPKLIAWSWKDWKENEPPLISDAAVTSLNRDLKQNNARRIRIFASAKQKSGWWSIYVKSLKPIQFKWKKVYSNV